MRLNQYLIITTVISFVAVACGTKKTPEGEVRDFVMEFGASLQKSDTLILEKFSTGQSRELLLAGIRVLQNVDMGYVKCTAAYDNPQITFIDHGVKVHIPITMTVDSLPDRRVDDSLVLVLERKGSTFVIADFQGEDFYRDFITLKNTIEFEMNQEAQLASRLEFYNKAKALQSKYDSVIWYTSYEGKNYFYVIKGKWNNYFIEDTEGSPTTTYAMGLVDQDGKEIVPLEFDLVGTPGIAAADIVEVKKDRLVGYYRLSDGKKLVGAEYQWILPSSPQSKVMLVKKDSVYGWLDESSKFHAGFPNAAAKQYVMNFDFLPDDFTIDESSQAMAEIPTAQYAAYGIVMPPSYLTSFGLFREVMAGFTIGDVQNMGYRQYVKTDSDFIENVTGKLSTLMTTITERYLEGREEFYKHKEITFLNDRREAVVTVDLSSSGETTFKKIDSTLLEVKVSPSVEESGGMGMDDEEYNLPTYRYFAIADNAITPIESERMFPCTERVMLDSSYLSGNFRRYDSEANQEVDADFLSKTTISAMRNEILASYGYTFTDPHTQDSFQYKKWYDPRFSSYSQFLEAMSPVDRHNLVFLERIVGTLDPSFSASL